MSAGLPSVPLAADSIIIIIIETCPPSPPLPAIDVPPLGHIFVMPIGPECAPTSHAAAPFMPTSPFSAASSARWLPAAPAIASPAIRSQRPSSAVAPSTTTAMEDAPAVFAFAAVMVKSSTFTPLAVLASVSAALSASPVSALFVVAPT